MEFNVSIVIPAHNEAEKIAGVLQKIKRILDNTSERYEIIVINDGSTDDTGQRARTTGVKVIDHAENLGYGHSLKDGIREASGKLILIIDADGTYDIDKIPEMIALAEEADLVVGKRIFHQKDIRNFKHLMREYFRNHTKYYSGVGIEDLNSGQRIFRRRDIIDSLNNYPDGFSFTSTMTVLYILKKKKIIYTPVEYHHKGRDSKFKSCFNFLSIIKLTFKLTYMARPLKLSLQLGCTLIIPLILTNIAGSLLNTNFLINLIFFILLYVLSVFLLLRFIYARGRRIA